jgi:hypothetical protein
MAQFTNTASGARGINMKDGSTTFVEPGQTVELNKTDVAKVHPDIEEGAKAAKEAEKAADDET